MSSHTKSFFQQDHSNKRRPGHWQKRPYDRPPLHEATNTSRAPKPPIPATSQAKSKLKAFELPKENSTRVPPGKENLQEEPCRQSDNVDTALEVSGVGQQPQLRGESKAEENGGAHHQAPPLPHANTFPSTPGSRLTLEDLIGDCDEIRKPERKHESPEEQIGWIANSSNSQLTPNRKRKRARSSSPYCPTTSSQRKENAAFIVSNANSAGKKTPEADPAADLWQRYGANKDGDGSLKLPDISHLISECSPRAFETPAKSGGLRRWASTGNDWPSSKAKRRRTTDKTSMSLWQDQPQESTEFAESAKSKVAAMVEQLHQSLATQKLGRPKPKTELPQDDPSSSSPLPDTSGDGMGPPKACHVQPVQSRSNATIHPQHTRANVSESLPEAQLSSTVAGDRIAAQPSESTSLAPLYLRSKTPLPVFKRLSISRTSGNSAKPPSPNKGPGVVTLCTNEELDEFGDALDFSAEDIDELVSQAPASHLTGKSLWEIPEAPVVSDAQDAVPQTAHQQIAAQIVIDDEDEDEFGSDGLDEAEFAKAEFSVTQAIRTSPRKQYCTKRRNTTQSPSFISAQASTHQERSVTPKPLYRYIVKQVAEGEYTNDKERVFKERVVLGENTRNKSMIAITLRGSWICSSVAPGNVVHVAYRSTEHAAVVTASPRGQIVVDDSEDSPYLIVQPDHMLSATTVADSFDCVRKAVLQDRIKATGETSKAMVYGKILHEVFQQALSANRWDESFLAELVERTVETHVEGLWELGMRDNVLALEEIKAKMGELAAWAGVFVTAEPTSEAVVDDKRGEKIWLSISKLIAIEEHIWAPRFGLKGNIDATIQASVTAHHGGTIKRLIVPFEVKTGRTTQSPAHRAQTALYTLLLSDRYDVEVQAGILYYLESSAMSRIAPPFNEVRQMVQQRNRLASYIHKARYPTWSQQQDSQPPAQVSQDIEESGLPALLKNPFKCGRCYAKQSCFTYHALTENGSADSAGMIDDGKKDHSLVWKEAVGHLVKLKKSESSEAQALKDWFVKWDKLLTFEESDLSRMRKELWTMSSAEREAAGRCFGKLVITRDLTATAAEVSSTMLDGIEGSGGRINRFSYTFARSSGSSGGSFAEGSQLTVGEPAVVSSEDGQWALANGYVIAVSRHEITVAVDRKLGNARQRLSDFDAERNQAFRGIMTVDDASSSTRLEPTSDILYRIDKDEFSNGLALVRNNLVTLMSTHPIHTKLREQLVLDRAPSFTKAAVPSLPPTQLGQMNEDQQGAVSKVMSSEDYALILGMPGTGKTTTIAHIIRALLAEGKTILLTSFTHTAVDNILLKIKDIAPPNSILRLGVLPKINPQVQKFCQLAAAPRKTIQEVDDAYMGCQIVATTCMGTNHPIFNRRTFDVCIVDEASQITLPISLGPLLQARRFVLVGDHYQLPPLVQNKAALEGGLDVSLFRQLSEQHPEAVATLGRQYRMCEDIMTLSNELIYHGKLRCGNDSVARQVLHLPNAVALDGFHNSESSCKAMPECWLREVTMPSRRVVFASTDACGKAALETLSAGKNITNELEATITAQIVVTLLAQGVPASDIGVITLYRSQLALIRRLFKLAHISSEVEVDSADRYQGRDKECIVLSMVRSNEHGTVGELLKDWRRVNVALTRARSKLVVLGSRRTLKHNELLAKFLDLVDERRWAIDLPKDADADHGFGFSSQAASGLLPSSVAKSPARGTIDAKKEDTAKTVLEKFASPARAVLMSSANAGNRKSPIAKVQKTKNPAKKISGSAPSSSAKARKTKENAVFEIFEDFMMDDI